MAKGDGCTRYREEKEIVRVFDCQFDPGFARRSRGWPARLGVRGRVKTEGEGGTGNRARFRSIHEACSKVCLSGLLAISAGRASKYVRSGNAGPSTPPSTLLRPVLPSIHPSTVTRPVTSL